MPCAAASKGSRRTERQELMRAAQNKAAGDPPNADRINAATKRLAADMNRVEDARLAQHTYTADEETKDQAGLLQPLRTAVPPGFTRPTLKQVAADFGIDPEVLERDKDSSQRFEI